MATRNRLAADSCGYNTKDRNVPATILLQFFEYLVVFYRTAFVSPFPDYFVLIDNTNISFTAPALDGNPLEPQLVSRPLKRSHPDFNATQPLPEAKQVSVTSNDNIDFPSFSQPGTSCI